MNPTDLNPAQKFYKKFFEQVNVTYPSEDPTLPDANYFSLLGIDESANDKQVIAEAQEQKRLTSRLKHSTTYKSLDITASGHANHKLPKAQKALADPKSLSDHRGDLLNKRSRYIGQKAKELRDYGVGRAQAEQTLPRVAGEAGLQPRQITGVIAKALKDAEPWPVGPGPGPGKLPWWVFPLCLFGACGAILVSALIHPLLAIVLTIGALVGAGVFGYLRRNRQKPWYLDRQVQKSAAWGAACVVGFVIWVVAVRPGTPPTQPPAPVDPGPPIVVTLERIPTKLARFEPPQNVPLRTFLPSPTEVAVPGTSSPEAQSEFTPDKAVDGNDSTSWVASQATAVVWLEVVFEQPRRIDGVLLLNGPHQPETGARIREATFQFDDGTPVPIELKDHAHWQLKPFEPRRTTTVRLTVKSIYPPEHDNQVPGLAEIWYAHSAGMDPSAVDWQGTWSSEVWGELEFEQHGDWVTGSFDQGAGLILARASERRLDGTWLVRPDFRLPNNGGDIRFQLRRDGKSFTGMWKSASQGDWMADDSCTGRRGPQE